MRPANSQQAQRAMHSLLIKKLHHISHRTQQAHLKRAKLISRVFYQHFQISPYQLQLKHLQWYLQTYIADLTPHTQYQHWLTLKKIIHALNKEQHWEAHLQGSWRRPR